MSETPTGLSGFTIGDLGVFIGTLGSVITGILIALQHSKCKNIKCGWGGCSCDRDLEAGQADAVGAAPVAPAAQADADAEEDIIPAANP
tara:strand:+ start:265 stop:531 length:267 start_codon:yes stop_codon:yes gene_type:complete